MLVLTQYVGFNPNSRHIIPPDLGSILDINATSFSDASAAFDDVTNQSAANGAKHQNEVGNPIMLGKTYSRPHLVSKMICYGSNDEGFLVDNNSSITITLYGKNGSAPSALDDGDNLGNVSFTDTTDESAGRTVNATTPLASYIHIWMHLATAANANFRIAEIQFYEG